LKDDTKRSNKPHDRRRDHEKRNDRAQNASVNIGKYVAMTNENITFYVVRSLTHVGDVASTPLQAYWKTIYSTYLYSIVLVA